MFVQLARALRDKPVERLEHYLVEKGYPDAMRFKTEFIGYNLYKSQYSKFILECLERSHGHREQGDLSRTQIEHIKPQTLSDKWLNDLGQEADRIYTTWLDTPGNLTLSAYNAEMWNSPYAVKKKQYEKSNIVMTRQLGAIQKWDEASIRKRAEELADRAIGIWKGPAAQQGMSRDDRLLYATELKIAYLEQKMQE